MFNTKEYMTSADFNADDYVKAAQIRRQRTNLQRSAFVAIDKIYHLGERY